MEREYRLSRIIITILMMIVSFIMLINEDISVKILGMSLFTSDSLLHCFTEHTFGSSIHPFVDFQFYYRRNTLFQRTGDCCRPGDAHCFDRFFILGFCNHSIFSNIDCVRS